MRTWILFAIWAFLVFPATAQHIDSPPPPYDLEPLTQPELASIWDAHQVWCLRQFEAKKIKTATGLTHCTYDGFGEAVAKLSPLSVDIFNTVIAKQFAIAHQYDHKKISWPQAKAESMEALSRLVTDVHLRATAFQQQDAERQRSILAQVLVSQAQADAQERSDAEARR